MNLKKSLYSLMILCAATMTLTACNGGGNSKPPPPPPQTWFFPEGAALTAAQISTFDSQGFYFNVHSAAFSGGEIRSQIAPAAAAFTSDAGVPAASNTFSTLLSGDQEVPVSGSKATGYGTIVFDPATKTISGVLITNSIAGTAAHIHDGLAGANGGVIVPLSGGPTVWIVPAGTPLTDAQIARLTAGAYYFNVHSAAAPNGEIRGQLNQQVRFAALSGSDEVPAVTSTATGTGVLALNPVTRQISGFVKTSGITGTVAHIHEAPIGVNGGVAVPLTETPAGSGLWVVPANSILTDAQIVSFNSGGLYFNIHSAANLGGEIRGQIIAAAIKVGSAALEGAKEVPPVTTTASGSGIMTLNSVTRQVNGSVNTTGIAGTLAHVHEATAGANGSVVIPLTKTPPLSTIQSPLAVSTSSLTNGSVGTTYSQTLTATGGTPPYRWSAIAGALPGGLNLSAAGIISGSPITAGAFTFTVQAADSAAPPATSTRELNIAITTAPAATVLFSTAIQPIFTANCTANCHSPGGVAAFLNLTPGNSYSALLQGPTPYVTAGSSANSRLYGRISGAIPPQMPLGQSPLSTTNQTLIKNWIDQGATNN